MHTPLIYTQCACIALICSLLIGLCVCQACGCGGCDVSATGQEGPRTLQRPIHTGQAHAGYIYVCIGTLYIDIYRI